MALAEEKQRYFPVLNEDVDFTYKIDNDAASCRTANTDYPLDYDWVNFWTERGESTNPAKLLCSQCVEIDNCLGFAMMNGEHHGIWGGTSERDRKEILKAYFAENPDPGNRPTKGEFAIANRERFVIAPKTWGPKTSFPPQIMRRALCITGKTREVFEELDSTPKDKITSDSLAKAIAICLQCDNEPLCDGSFIDAGSKPTVAGGEVIGNIPVKIRPTKRQIKSFLPEPKTPSQPENIRRVREEKLTSKRAEASNIEQGIVTRGIFVNTLGGGLLSTLELENLYRGIKEGRNGHSAEPLSILDILTFTESEESDPEAKMLMAKLIAVYS